MKAPRLNVAQGLSLLGVPGCLGIALLLVAAWFYRGEAPAAQQSLIDEQDSIAHLREQLTLANTQSGDAPASQALAPEAAWQQLWQSLPSAQAGEQMQARLLATAQQHGVQVATVQFQGDVLPGLPAVWRQRITMPVEASYPALRQWMNVVLQLSEGSAHVSLDALAIDRADVMSNTVKARVVWSLWWKAAP